MNGLSEKGLELLERTGLTLEKFKELLLPYPVPPALVLGVIHTESGGNPDALRFEPGYRYLFEPASYAKLHGWTKETEETLQKFSYGLMQIMGAVAREQGFKLHPKLLLVPTINLSWSLLHFWSLKQRFGGWPEAVAAYNWGHPARTLLGGKFKNQDYVDKVFAAAMLFEGGHV